MLDPHAFMNGLTSNSFYFLRSSTVNLIPCFYFGRESDITRERIEKIIKAGGNVVLTTKGIDDM